MMSVEEVSTPSPVPPLPTSRAHHETACPCLQVSTVTHPPRPRLPGRKQEPSKSRGARQWLAFSVCRGAGSILRVKENACKAGEHPVSFRHGGLV